MAVPRTRTATARHTAIARVLAVPLVAALLALVGLTGPGVDTPDDTDPRRLTAAAAKPNIFFYNLDDLRAKVPQGIDPLQYMPKTRQWMAAGTSYTNAFVSSPSCCPSRASWMTGRYPHNNGVRTQGDGPKFDSSHSAACYLRNAGYSTYFAGKFLVSWPKTQLPPCFDRSTVMWEGYFDVAVRVDGVARTAPGYSTTYLGVRGREYVTQALSGTKPFFLYEAPQAPHWVSIRNPDGTESRLAQPEAKYAGAAVGDCSGPRETDRADKPPYVRSSSFSDAAALRMCRSQMRAIMSADDQFAATMQLLEDRGVLANTMVVLSSDNGYMWGEHNRTEKFVPYEPSVRVPLLVRWPGRLAAGTSARMVSAVDLLPTMLQAAQATRPAGSPALDGESLLVATRRTAIYAEYSNDCANGCGIPSWRMLRTGTVKYVETLDAQGRITFREYYRLATDPVENVNVLRDASTANDPPASELSALSSRLGTFARCAGPACLTS